jgi:hypothetical protein
MHCIDDLRLKFELCIEIKKKRRKYMKYSKTLSKTKIGNQALINVPLAKKKLNPKLKKEILLCREPRHRLLCRGWAVGKEVYSADGSSQLSAKASQP